jgi:phage terminase small subunit
LAIYCKALVQERVAAGELRAAGYVNGGKPSPWLKVWTDSREAVTTLARMLSLNPQGRSGLVPERQNVSYYEKMNLLEGQRREPQ